MHRTNQKQQVHIQPCPYEDILQDTLPSHSQSRTIGLCLHAKSPWNGPLHLKESRDNLTWQWPASKKPGLASTPPPDHP
jgi:hypothetical protein